MPCRKSLFAERARLAAKAELPDAVLKEWPPASDLLEVDLREAEAVKGALADLPIDHGVGPVATRGGQPAAWRVLTEFLDERLARYADERNETRTRGVERPVAVSALRPPLGARRVFNADDARGLDDEADQVEGGGASRRLVGASAARRRFSTS